VPLSPRAFGALSIALAVFPALGQVRHAATSRASASLAELARRTGPLTAAGDQQREVYEPERAVRRRNSARTGALPAAHQPDMSPAALTAAAPPSFAGFLGLSDNFTVIPPDTQGAVGPNHVVTMLNTQVLIQSRSGVAQANFPITLNTFWSPLGQFTDTFDPRIFYDSAGARWIASAAVNGDTASSALLIATTQTADPTGTWNYYKITVGAANQWGDFPELGFNANWVVVSMNMFQINGSYINTNLYVFSKADLYSSTGAGTHSVFSDDRGEFAPVRDYDNSHPNTLYLVQQSPTDFSSSPNTGEIRVSKLSGTVGAETFTGGNGGTAIINDPWSDTGGNSDFGPQLGATAKIDTGDSRLANCIMRAGTIWCAHTVFLPYPRPTRAAAQWFQLDPTANPPAILQRGRIDDSSGTFFYAYPTIAVNKNNDALIGYTRFSANSYPTAAFAWRSTADPPGLLQPEVVVKAGESTYVAAGSRTGSNRWGDYSATVVDPVNDLAFWTLQEYAATPPATRNGAFATWWAQVNAPSVGPVCSFTVTASKSTFDTSGGAAGVTVATAAGCTWQAASNATWITVTAGSPGSGNGTAQFTVAKTPDAANFRTGTLTVAGQTITITQGTPTSAGSPPAFAAQSLVNAASMQAGAVAPGEVITIFGTNLGPAALQKPLVTAGQVDTIAGGTRVLFDGIAAPMIYAVAGQVAAVVPFALQGHSTTQLQVEYQGTRSSSITIPVAAASPAIFTISQSGKGPGAILNDDNSVNSQDSPATAGKTTIVIYATGGGVLFPAVPDGALAQTLSTIAQRCSVRIGGLPATVTYAGAAPGIIEGVVQINAVVPAGIVRNSAVPVDVTVGAFTSPAGVTIAVR
jgi:uncharacterized protein (TIGR03437 family)